MLTLNNKQRAFLSSQANALNAILQIGQASLTPEMVQSVDEALEARELIKIHVLKNCFDDPREIAEMLADRSHAAVVRVIGKMIILYRPSKKPKIDLPE